MAWLNSDHSVDDEFAHAIWELYFSQLVTLARRKLGSLPRREEDEEDAALSALGSFLSGAKKGRFGELSDHDELWRLLATITVRKVAAQRRRFFSQRRGAGEVRDESVLGQNEDVARGLDQLFADPTTELADDLIATRDEMLEKLRDPQLRAIALYKMESYSNDEVAALIGCSLRTVNRKLDRIRSLWQEAS